LVVVVATEGVPLVKEIGPPDVDEAVSWKAYWLPGRTGEGCAKVIVLAALLITRLRLTGAAAR
jgi:hypothetical protein